MDTHNHWPSCGYVQVCHQHYREEVLNELTEYCQDFLNGLEDLVREAEEDSRLSWKRVYSVKNWSPRDSK